MTTSKQLQVFGIEAFQDNYIWCIHNNREAIIVDPGDAKPVLSYLNSKQLDLKAIIITHRHWDHVDGIPTLIQQYPHIPVYGPASIGNINQAVKGGTELRLPLKLKAMVLDLPGHTAEHIGYYFAANNWLFSGDTLFYGGCGRIELPADVMYHTLNQLKALPTNTLVYCTHEYSEANLKFAAEYNPHNSNIEKHLNLVQALRRQHKPTLPTTIANELECNLYFHAQTVAEFAKVRKAKDCW